MAVRHAPALAAGHRRGAALLAAIVLRLGAPSAGAVELPTAPAPRLADLRHGIAVHYIEQGSDPTVVFVHVRIGAGFD
jgi:hypothetical protein